MAMTDTTTTHETASGSDASAPAARPSLIVAPSGLAGIFGTGDHKTLGRLYIGFSLLFGLIAFAAAGLFELSIKPDGAVLDVDKAFSAFTLGQLSLVFLFLVPLFIGLATAITPLQVGASTIAFPRAAAAAFWTWLISSVGFLTGYGINGAIGNGGDLDAQALTLLSLGGVVIALLLASVCVATTVIAFRPPGMSLDRVPLFSWSMLVAAGLWGLTLPVFLGNIVLVFVDVKYGNAGGVGVAFNQWRQLAWIVTQPQIFVYAIPALGIIGDIVATFARGRVPQRGVLLGAIAAFGALGFGAYVQVAYNARATQQWLYTAQGVLIVLPLLALVGATIATFRKGTPKIAGPVVLALASLLLLLLAATAGAAFGTGRLGLQVTSKLLADTSQPLRSASTGSPIYTWGITYLVVLAAATAAVGGLFYWAPKLTGRRLADGLAKLLAPVLLGAAVLAGAPLLVLGFVNKQESLADSAGGFYVITAAGTGLALLVLLLSFAVFVQSRAVVLAGGEVVDPDAWGVGQSLEWLTESPPAAGNFGVLAPVTSPEPLLDLATPEGEH